MLNSVRPYQNTTQTAQRLSFKYQELQIMDETDATLLAKDIETGLKSNPKLKELSNEDRKNVLKTLANSFEKKAKTRPEFKNFSMGFMLQAFDSGV